MYCCFSIHAVGVSLILYFYCKVSSEALHCVIMRPIYTGQEESGCVLLFFYTCNGRKFDSLFPLQSILRGTPLRYNEIYRSGGIWMSIVTINLTKVEITFNSDPK